MTSLILRSPLERAKRLSAFDEMENFVDRFFNSYQQLGTEEQMIHAPLELVERDDKFIMKASLPGMKKEDINIEVSEDQINLSGEYKSSYEEDKDLIHRSEFYTGKFSRSLPLPQKVDHQNVKAEYNDGILTLTLPKLEKEVNKMVKISL